MDCRSPPRMPASYHCSRITLHELALAVNRQPGFRQGAVEQSVFSAAAASLVLLLLLACCSCLLSLRLRRMFSSALHRLFLTSVSPCRLRFPAVSKQTSLDFALLLFCGFLYKPVMFQEKLN